MRCRPVFINRSPPTRFRGCRARTVEAPASLAKPPKLVLVVDDEGDIVDLLATLFDHEEFRVLRAYDGELAWRLVLGFRPDLVISDVAMPRLDGVGLLCRLRHADPP